MNYEQSNVGSGMVPHKKSCRCDECEIERLTAEHRIQNECIADQHDKIRRLQARVETLEGICNKAAGAIITKKYKIALAAVIGGVPEAATERRSPKPGEIDEHFSKEHAATEQGESE